MGNTITKFQSKITKIVFIISYLLLFLGILSRDIRLHNLLINNITSAEFSVSNLFCSELPRCSRVGSEVFGISIRTFFELAGYAFHRNPAWQNFYITDAEYFSIYNLMGSIAYRIISLLPILYFLNKVSGKSNRIKIFNIFALNSILSGFPLFLLNNLFGIYLVNYDYMIIFVLGIFLINYNKILESKYLLPIFIFICSFTFENLIIVIIVSIIFQNSSLLKKLKTIFKAVAYFLFSYTSLLLIIWVRNGEILNESDGRYFYLNQVKLIEIWGAFFIIIIWSSILGVIVAIIEQKKVKPYELASLGRNEDLDILAAIVISYLLSFLIGNFISGLTEFARQFLFLEISAYMFALILTTRVLEKLRRKQ